jgi:hypothetical protein
MNLTTFATYEFNYIGGIALLNFSWHPWTAPEIIIMVKAGVLDSTKPWLLS